MNQTRYSEKQEPGSSHDLLRKWFSGRPVGLRVLDVGTADGTLGKMLAGTGCEIVGIEPEALWAEAARPFYQDIFIGRLEDVPADFLAGKDVIVCADVLEHLPDPDVQLSRIVQLQNPETIFLICVPNVANFWIRLQLLMGRFEYTERGILDRTHLRFFTFSSFVELLTTSRLKPRKITPTPIPISLIFPRFFHTSLGKIIQKIVCRLTIWFPRILGYQFFAVCQVSDRIEEK